MNRPERRNALSPAVMEQLAAAIGELDADEQRALHRDRRHRRGVRGRRGHQGDGRAHASRRCWRRPRCRSGSASPTAAPPDRRGVGVRARRRLRACAAVRHDRRVRDGGVRAARDHARDHPGRRRHAAPGTRDRQAAHDGAGAHRAAHRRHGGASPRVREQGRRRRRRWFSDALELAEVVARRPPLAVKLAKQAVLAADEMPLDRGASRTNAACTSWRWRPRTAWRACRRSWRSAGRSSAGR